MRHAVNLIVVNLSDALIRGEILRIACYCHTECSHWDLTLNIDVSGNVLWFMITKSEHGELM